MKTSHNYFLFFIIICMDNRLCRVVAEFSVLMHPRPCYTKDNKIVLIVPLCADFHKEIDEQILGSTDLKVR